MNSHTQRALLLVQQGRYEQAERLLGLELADDPDNAFAHAMLGLCLSGQNKHAEAAERSHQAIALAPDDQFVRLLAGEVALARDDLDAAHRLASESIAMDPQDDRGYVIRAQVHAIRRQWNDCLQDSGRALSIDPENTAALNLQSMANRGLGNRGTGATDVAAALASDPEDPYTHNNAGWANLEKGDYRQAETHFREALRLDPSLENARVGVLETTKSRFPAYRWFLQLMLRIAKLPPRLQLGLFLGLWFGAQLMGGIAEGDSPLKWVALPILLLYIAFCIATWFWRAITNAALLLHPFARLALTGKEKAEAVVAMLGFLVCAVLIVGVFATDSLAWPIGLRSLLGPLLALMFSFQMNHPKPQRWLLIAAAALTINNGTAYGVAGYMGLFGGIERPMPAWLGEEAFSLMANVMRWSPLAVLLGSQMLGGATWRKD